MRGRLAILYFLQFAVWGCYLSTLGQMLGAWSLRSYRVRKEKPAESVS